MTKMSQRQIDNFRNKIMEFNPVIIEKLQNLPKEQWKKNKSNSSNSSSSSTDEIVKGVFYDS